MKRKGRGVTVKGHHSRKPSRIDQLLFFEKKNKKQTFFVLAWPPPLCSLCFPSLTSERSSRLFVIRPHNFVRAHKRRFSLPHITHKAKYQLTKGKQQEMSSYNGMVFLVFSSRLICLLFTVGLHAANLFHTATITIVF